MVSSYSRYAFISYNRCDEKWAKWLQRKLESYKLPAELHNEFENSRYLRPIFRDKTDLNTGILADELRIELEQSKFLIVICSPNSAKSSWVSDEVKAFIEMGRIDHIIPFIVAGTPHRYRDGDLTLAKSDECFPYYLRVFTHEHPELELLGVNIHEVGKEPAFIRVVSRMLSLGFDVLWERHKRYKRNCMIVRLVLASFFLLIIGFVWHSSQPFDISLVVADKSKFPQHIHVEGVVSIELSNDILKDSIVNLSLPLHFKNIPSKYRGQKARVVFEGYGFKYLDTMIELNNEIVIYPQRNPQTYGLIKGYTRDYEDNPMSGVRVEVCGCVANSGLNGYFELLLPLEVQQLSNIGYTAVVTVGNRSTESVVYPIGDNNIKNTIYIE